MECDCSSNGFSIKLIEFLGVLLLIYIKFFFSTLCCRSKHDSLSHFFVCLFACLFVFLLGCPTQGYYGENCSLQCPRNCEEGHCNIVDGTCMSCVDGYSGPYCNNGSCVSSEMLCILLLTYKIESTCPEPKFFINFCPINFDDMFTQYTDSDLNCELKSCRTIQFNQKKRYRICKPLFYI